MESIVPSGLGRRTGWEAAMLNLRDAFSVALRRHAALPLRTYTTDVSVQYGHQ